LFAHTLGNIELDVVEPYRSAIATDAAMLTGAERKALREAVLTAFDYEGLKQALVEAANSRDLGDLVSPEASFDDRVTQLITRSIKEGWVQELLQTLLDARRGKADFVDVVGPIAERSGSRSRSVVVQTRRYGPWIASGAVAALAVVWFAVPTLRNGLMSKFQRFSCDNPQSVFGNVAQTWKLVDAIDMVLPVKTFNQPHAQCESAQALDSDTFKAKFGSDVAISEANIRNIDWYKIEPKDQPPTYVRKSDIPVWMDAPDVEIVQPVDVRAIPAKTASVATLQPDEFRKLARHRAPRKAAIGGETWFRLSAPGDASEMFFPETENASRIVEWRSIAGCLVTKAVSQGFVRTWRSPLGSDAIDQLPPNSQLGPIVQESKNGTQPRLRFGKSSADFKYVERDDVEVLDAAKCKT
jgi:hypothetical protein